MIEDGWGYAEWDFQEQARRVEDRDVRILRRIAPRPYAPIESRDGIRLGLIVDVETTGFDPVPRFEGDREPPDEILELCALPFTYRTADDALIAVHPPYRGLRQPSRPIPAKVAELTGISDAMVRGQTITREAFEAAIGDPGGVAVVLAHNARFDRGFLEAFPPLAAFFRRKPWACTIEDADWPGEGLESGKLAFVAAMGFGLFYDAHRAEEDCKALAEILALPMPASGVTTLAKVLASARRGRHRVRAFAPFACRHALKARGYRWDPGAPGRAKAWFKDVSDLAAAEDETAFVLGLEGDATGPSRSLIAHIDARERHSPRAGVAQEPEIVEPTEVE